MEVGQVLGRDARGPVAGACCGLSLNSRGQFGVLRAGVGDDYDRALIGGVLDSEDTPSDEAAHLPAIKERRLHNAGAFVHG